MMIIICCTVIYCGWLSVCSTFSITYPAFRCLQNPQTRLVIKVMQADVNWLHCWPFTALIAVGWVSGRALASAVLMSISRQSSKAFLLLGSSLIFDVCVENRHACINDKTKTSKIGSRYRDLSLMNSKPEKRSVTQKPRVNVCVCKPCMHACGNFSLKEWWLQFFFAF